MITYTCDRCGVTYEDKTNMYSVRCYELGRLKSRNTKTYGYHICKTCFKIVQKIMEKRSGKK